MSHGTKAEMAGDTDTGKPPSGAVRADDDQHVRQHIRNMEAWRERAKTSPRSRRVAIRAYCVECVGGNTADVTNCCCTNCLLYKWRMG